MILLVIIIISLIVIGLSHWLLFSAVRSSSRLSSGAPPHSQTCVLFRYPQAESTSDYYLAQHSDFSAMLQHGMVWLSERIWNTSIFIIRYILLFIIQWNILFLKENGIKTPPIPPTVPTNQTPPPHTHTKTANLDIYCIHFF